MFIKQPFSRLAGAGVTFLALTALGGGGGGGAGALAQDTIVVVTEQQCRELARHRPDPSVEYQPGVDARGRAVAPADLDGGVSIDLPRSIRIPLEVDILQPETRPSERTGPRNRVRPTAEVGVVELDLENGRATYNGQPLQSEAQAELAARCQEVLREGGQGD